MTDPICRECNRAPCGCATPRTDEPIEDLVKRDQSGWAEFIWNCAEGGNYFRYSEYCRLIRDLEAYASDLAAAVARAEQAERERDDLLMLVRTVMAIPKMTDAQLAELKANCQAAIAAKEPK